ncbi:MAG: hypothetical protein ACFFAN_19170 [Promethearchaeota archaeon]
MEEYKDFMSEKGILFLIAKEFGVNIRSPDIDFEVYKEIDQEVDYDEFAIKISDISENMNNIVLLGRIGKIFGKKSFIRKDSTLGFFGSFIIYDDSGSVKVVLWGDRARIIGESYFKINELVRIIGGYSKVGLNQQLEVNLGKRGKILLAPEDIDSKKVPKVRTIDSIENSANIMVKIDDLYDMKEGFIPRIEGIVDNIEEFKELRLKSGDKSFLLKIILRDDTSSIKMIAWGMNAIECLKSINIGDKVRLSNSLLKYNTYNNFNELHFVKSSKLVKI